MKRISLLKKIVIKINLMLRYAPLSINLYTADMDFHEVLAVLQEGLEEHRARNVITQ